MKQIETKQMPKNAIIYECIKCDFRCSKKSNYTIHLTTAKHNCETNMKQLIPENNRITSKIYRNKLYL